MLGNDVVDLADPEARESALHPRFDERVFAPCERALLARSPERSALRWALWAAKEAACKAARQRDPRLAFHPRAFRVEGDRARLAAGGFLVRHAASEFRVRVRRAGDALHAVALPAGAAPRRLAARSAALPPGLAPGAAVRALARRVASALLGADAAELEIVSRDRVPFLLLRGEPCAAWLSLSHHGRRVACAVALPGAERA